MVPLKKNAQTEIDFQSKKYGYRISESDEAVKQAIETGFRLVQQVKDIGHDIRKWSLKTNLESIGIVKKLETKTFHVNKKNIGASDSERKLWEVAYWENEISRKLRLYFCAVSNYMNDLKKLNPPLKADQIDPFLQAMLTDRRLTLKSLEPLTQIVGRLQQIKTKLCVDPAIHYNYQPQG